MLSRMVITFLPRSKRLLISWLRSPSAVILEPPKIKSVTVSPSSNGRPQTTNINDLPTERAQSGSEGPGMWLLWLGSLTSPREGESLPGRLRWSNQREGRNQVSPQRDRTMVFHVTEGLHKRRIQATKMSLVPRQGDVNGVMVVEARMKQVRTECGWGVKESRMWTLF